MGQIYAEKGRWKLTMEWIEAGEDLVVAVKGGDTPHIGCIMWGVPRTSLNDANKISSTISILNITGHQDDKVARPVLHRLICKLNRKICFTCGIHLDDVFPNEIEQAQELMNNLADQLLESYNCH